MYDVIYDFKIRMQSLPLILAETQLQIIYNQETKIVKF